MKNNKYIFCMVLALASATTFLGVEAKAAEANGAKSGGPELRLNEQSPIEVSEESVSAEVGKDANLAENQIPLGIEPDVEKLDKAASAKALSTKSDSMAAPAASEENIPLFKKSELKAAATSDSTLTKLILTLAVMTGLFAVGWVYLKRWSKRGPSSHDVHKIKILTQHYLGPKKSLVIVRVAGETMMIGVTESNISMIKSLSLLDEEIPEQVPQDFAGSLDEQMEQEEPSEREENFALAGLNEVRDRVSRRISNMRNMN